MIVLEVEQSHGYERILINIDRNFQKNQDLTECGLVVRRKRTTRLIYNMTSRFEFH